MRFVKEQLVIRLQQALSAEQMAGLNADFKDINVKGSITASPPFEEERDHRGLSRIAFQFNRTNFGRLRQLIDRLNSF